MNNQNTTKINDSSITVVINTGFYTEEQESLSKFPKSKWERIGRRNISLNDKHSNYSDLNILERFNNKTFKNGLKNSSNVFYLVKEDTSEKYDVPFFILPNKINKKTEFGWVGFYIFNGKILGLEINIESKKTPRIIIDKENNKIIFEKTTEENAVVIETEKEVNATFHEKLETKLKPNGKIYSTYCPSGIKIETKNGVYAWKNNFLFPPSINLSNDIEISTNYGITRTRKYPKGFYYPSFKPIKNNGRVIGI